MTSHDATTKGNCCGKSFRVFSNQVVVFVFVFLALFIYWFLSGVAIFLFFYN